MGKFGKKHVIDINPLNYQICLSGLGGIGKTTLAKEVCEKLVGEDGYIHLNIGREGGIDAIQNIVSESIEDWAKLTEVIDDIVENKDTDYPSLKVVIWDSLDELIRLGEAETIRLENKKSPEKKVDSILGCRGGFGKGQDFCINMILDQMWQLKTVGVNSFIIAHTKRSDIIDPVTQETYSQLTADAQQRYFNAVRNKMDVIAVGYIDREIAKENTGRKNIVNKQDITINKVTSETRVITFRDDSYSIDSKSRFANIVDKIPFDSDAFITALTDAIKAEAERGGQSMKDLEKEQKKRDKEQEKRTTENSAKARAKKAEEELEEQRPEVLSQITNLFKSATAEQKEAAKKALNDGGFTKFSDPDVPVSLLKEIINLF